jgi:hypothetical protein
MRQVRCRRREAPTKNVRPKIQTEALPFTDNAKEKLANKIPKGVYGSVYFLDKENILELIEQYWLRR